MAGLADVFSEQKRTNWLKACLGLNIAKHALEVFVDREMKDAQSVANFIFCLIIKLLKSAKTLIVGRVYLIYSTTRVVP
ncbi:hypothetical protein DPMN_161756 [Dreissena polymorpha]|uniref:Uncharacterized protein n=1 Tax=Dreissena polymorpha TaxID=45954 RepID=A0A9D4ESQ1_DREPO|nr:hypothetical protein DPMN_161756 [Dreissena polymorpha]